MATFLVYQPFESTDIIVGKTNQISSGFFPDGNVYYSQSSLLTSPLQTQTVAPGGNQYDVLNGLYYTNLFNNSATDPQLMFSVSYGDANNSGSFLGSPVPNTQTIHSQYRNVLLGTGNPDGLFSFRTGSVSTDVYVESPSIYIINFSAQLMSGQIDPGQWNISLSGSNGLFSFIDDFPLLSPSQQQANSLVYEIISGSFDSVTGQTVAGSGGYGAIGLFYPRNGVMIFNASTINALVGVGWNTGSISVASSKNDYLFANNIINANVQMRVRKSEFVPSTHYFCRVKNQDFNFSNNPTFAYQTNDPSGSYSQGDIISSMVANPQTYVTTVGLYDDLNELVAVAKLSQPTMKNNQNELLLRIRLDF